MAIQAGETTFYQAKRGIVQDGLVLNLDAAVDASYSGGTTWRDLEGGNNGTFINMDGANFSDENGGVLNFDGTDDYVETASNVNITGSADRTLCVWYYHNTRNVTNSNVVGYGVNGNGQIFDILSRHDSGYDRVIGHFYGAGFDTISSLPSRSTTNYLGWNYACMTKKGTLVSVYANGEFSNSGSFNLNTSNSTLKIGKGTWNSINNYNGKIASVHLYDRALTADEIRQNYLATKERYA